VGVYGTSLFLAASSNKSGFNIHDLWLRQLGGDHITVYANAAKISILVFSRKLVRSTKNLSEVTQQEFDKLIQAQKDQPKSMEDIARASMKTGDIVANDVAAIKEAVVRGAVSTSFVKDNMEAFRKIVTTPTGSISKEIARTEIFSKEFDTAANAIRDAVKEMTKTGGKSMGDIMKDLGGKFGEQSKSVTKVVEGLSQKIYSDIKGKNLSYGDSELGAFANSALRGLESYIDKTPVGKAVAAEKGGTSVKATPSKSLLARLNLIFSQENKIRAIANKKHKINFCMI
jgi:hypothetical protein